MLHEVFLKKEDVIESIINPFHAPLNNKKNKIIRFIDLFCGCGGLSCGIIQAAHENGFDSACALAVDLKPAPLEVYKMNIPHDEDSIYNGNILDIFNIYSGGKLSKNEIDLKDRLGSIDFLVAGPPCQGHSNLNNSTRRSDPRNNLYLACIRAIELFRPEVVIVENVPSVIHSKEGVVQVTENKLIEIGYRVSHLNINFLDLGIPQSRKRHVLIASKSDGFCETIKTNSIRRQNPMLKEFIFKINKDEGLLSKSGKLSQENLNRIDYLFENNLFDLPNEFRPSCHRDKPHSYKSSYGRLHWNEPAQTLTSGYGSMGQGRYIHPSEKRTINSREAARIQGFPDSYSFSKVSKITDLREMIANAVPPQLTYVISNAHMRQGE